MRIITLLLLLSICGTAYGELPEQYDSVRLCNAIYKAEGGKKAQFLYGIRSVPYKNEREARRICLNTINNNKRRFYAKEQNKYKDYLEFLCSRYAPLNANNDPKNLNANWLKNVRYFYNKEA